MKANGRLVSGTATALISSQMVMFMWASINTESLTVMVNTNGLMGILTLACSAMV
jgi:hypothetical protein